jgi:hypothetical protein
VKYKYEFPVYPMSEIPKREFRYVYINGLTSVSQPHERFRLEERNSVGWIYVKAEKTPILEDGKWYLVRQQSQSEFDLNVLYYNDGLFRLGKGSQNSYQVNEFTVIAEMQEVAQ